MTPPSDSVEALVERVRKGFPTNDDPTAPAVWRTDVSDWNAALTALADRARLAENRAQRAEQERDGVEHEIAIADNGGACGGILP